MSKYLFALIVVLAWSRLLLAAEHTPGASRQEQAGAVQPASKPPAESRPDLDMDALLSKSPRGGRGRISDPIPAADYLSTASVPLTAKERQAVKMAESWEAQSAPPIQANGKVIYTFGASYPTVVGVPNLICDIELQPGENVNEVVIGDSARWLADTAKSGTTTHVLVKPMDAGLMTSAVITTDRRVYHIKLISQRIGLTPYVGFLYPDEASGLRQKLSDAKEVREREQRIKAQEPAPSDPSALRFHYDVQGSASWKPVQVYDDGRQTFINFPSAMQSNDAPVLLVKSGGQDTIANFRMKGTSMIVDGVFDEAILLSGVGWKQQKISIRKKS